MPPKMADHSVKARQRMRTSLNLERDGAGVPPVEEPAADQPQLDPEAVSNALRALADRFVAKPAEGQQQQPGGGVTQLMSQFAPNTGQPAQAAPEDNTGQKNDGELTDQRIRQAVEKAMGGKA